MSIWAIGDLHLAFHNPLKKMDFFGPGWENYTDRIKENWLALIKPDDLVLIPGDISWAMHLEDASIDLEWIDALPGTKVLLRGNHDYWWSSLSKMEKVMPPSLHLIQNNVFEWENYIIGGARLWDTKEFNFSSFIHYQENPREKKKEAKDHEEEEKIFLRELQRLDLSLKGLQNSSLIKIAMTHYPPIGADLKSTTASRMLKHYGIETCVFGHLHSVKKEVPLFGSKEGIRYILTSADYLNFKPIQLY